MPKKNGATEEKPGTPEAKEETVTTPTVTSPTIVPVVSTSNSNVALVPKDDKLMAEIRQLSNTKENAVANIPTLKLEHTTTIEGEPNELRGHFTVSRKNELGEYIKQDLGPTIKFEFLLQRYFLKLIKGNDSYSSSEFESETDIVALWKRTGDASELYTEGVPYEIQKRFLKKDDQNRIRSELNRLVKIYVLLNGELVAWKLSLTGTIAWSKYQRLVTFASGVVTAAGAIEMKKGTVKYYQPEFKADSKIKDLKLVKDNIQNLKDLLPKATQQEVITIDGEDDLPFK